MHYSIDAIQKTSHELALRTEIEAGRATSRWSHAKELLGPKYHKSVVKSGEKIADMDEMLTNWTNRALKGRWKKYARSVAQTIIQESDKYGFDPIFLMAVIENESSFNPEIIGTVGEIGLMQVTPDTGAWIAKIYNLPWKGKQQLKDPSYNIRIGAAYMAHLREEFDFEGQLYLAAYNMGSGNVRKALGKQIRPKIYSSRVMLRYLRFYSELQKEVTKKID
ncbi:MAG: lytic transglycosylase domain-containing protein [Bdellovibrionia bacterium]